MNIHKNARLTLRGREELIDRTQQGAGLGATAARLGVSRRTAGKWVARYREEGPAGLLDRSSRPHRSPRQLAGRLVLGARVLRQQRWTCAQIAAALEISRATVARVVGRCGWSRLGRLSAPPLVQRYEHPVPGDLLHVDTKKLGRICGLGHRITGQRAHQVSGSGWEVLHVAVDDHSRVAYVELLPDECGGTVSAFLGRAVRWFRQHGVRVRRVLSDNGSGYISHSFRRTCQQLRLIHRRTRPYTPRTNGKAERFIQTALREWAYARPFYNSAQRAALLPGWMEHYNCARPHTSLGALPPFSRLIDGNNVLRLHS